MKQKNVSGVTLLTLHSLQVMNGYNQTRSTHTHNSNGKDGFYTSELYRLGGEGGIGRDQRSI